MIHAVTLSVRDAAVLPTSGPTPAAAVVALVPVEVKIPETSIFSPMFVAPLIRRKADAIVGDVTTAEVLTEEKSLLAVTAAS